MSIRNDNTQETKCKSHYIAMLSWSKNRHMMIASSTSANLTYVLSNFAPPGDFVRPFRHRLFVLWWPSFLLRLCYRCGISVLIAEQSGNGVPSLPSLAALLAFEFEFVKDWSVRRHICLKIDLISLVTNAHRHHITMMCSLCR